MKKINVVLRTCDQVSLVNNRIVPKNECVVRCLRSLVNSLENYGNYSLHIIDDNSSQETREQIQTIAKSASFDFLSKREDSHLNSRQKSRFSVKVAYDYIDTLPLDELVYIVEDDYLHYPDSISKMIGAWEYFASLDPNINVGIFPQDFVELYPHPQNKFSDTYIRPCVVLPGPDRYYRTTWFTQESFMVSGSLIKKYKHIFDTLLNIGSDPAYWEGNTISGVWNQPDVRMLMPLGTLAIHVSKKEDLSFFCNDFETLWESNKE